MYTTTFRIAPIGAVWVRLDELPDGQAISGLGRGNAGVLAHEILLSFTCSKAQ
jgi:hypothetical protein